MASWGTKVTLHFGYARGTRYVNVNVATPEGIRNARAMGIAGSPLMEAAYGSRVYRDGHPVDRIGSLFHYLQVADWEASYRPEWANWTIEEYSLSDHVESDWMTRYLTNKVSGELFEEDLEEALEILRSKVLVGLTSRMEESISRFTEFFHWKDRECSEYFDASNSKNENRKKKVEEGSKTWKIIAGINKYDVILYEAALDLFDEQAKMFTNHSLVVDI